MIIIPDENPTIRTCEILGPGRYHPASHAVRSNPGCFTERQCSICKGRFMIKISGRDYVTCNETCSNEYRRHSRKTLLHDERRWKKVQKTLLGNNTAMAPKAVLLPLHERHAAAIYAGRKAWEFRTFAIPRVDSIFIYETIPVQRITGMIGIGRVIVGSPAKIWEDHAKGTGIGESEFFKRFGTREQVLAHEISIVEKLPVAWDPVELFKEFHPPQGFRYIPANAVPRVRVDCYHAVMARYRAANPDAVIAPITRQFENSPLSPSWDLLHRAKREKWAYDRYCKNLEAEFESNPESERELDRLADLYLSGKSVFLVCVEKDAAVCHRSLVKMLLEKRICEKGGLK